MRFVNILRAGLVLVFLTGTITLAQGDAVQHTTALVQTHPDLGDVQEVEGAQAQLFATENGLTVTFSTTGLEEGHVYTAWWVIVNNPESCGDEPCTDLLGNVEELQTEVTWADGILVGEEGRMVFASYLPAGEEVPEGWYGNGLTNPLGAEVRIVIHDHGPIIPEMVGDMINSLRAGCTDESVPADYPDHAKADGEAGPNTCRLVQFALFQQGM
jgi:hypothetical protein